MKVRGAGPPSSYPLYDFARTVVPIHELPGLRRALRPQHLGNCFPWPWPCEGKGSRACQLTTTVARRVRRGRDIDLALAVMKMKCNKSQFTAAHQNRASRVNVNVKRFDQNMSLKAPRWFTALEKATQNPNSSCERSGVPNTRRDLVSTQFPSQCFN
jgi:hypothetical protein